MLKSNIFIVFCMACGIAFLSALGFWQLQRLEWKENLIASVEERRKADPVSLTQLQEIAKTTGEHDYLAVEVGGVFDHTAEQFYYVTKKGKVGWHVYTPLKLDAENDSQETVLIVNRGFVPAAFKEQNTRLDGLPRGKISFDGLARLAPSEKPNRFVPDNDLEKNIYHWKSRDQMIAQIIKSNEGYETASFLEFFVDVGEGFNQGKLPEGGSTRVSFPNSHLSYAFTWFGLAFALLGVGTYFLYSRRNKNI